MNQPDMDEIYRSLPPDRIPWNIETPPRALVDLVESGTVKPGRALDLGCGAGNYAVYLAGKGFEVTGIDIAPTAIELAGRNAAKTGVTVRFATADVLGDLAGIGGPFDFIYDWEVLHHVFPEKREQFVRNVRAKLAPGGRYLSVCFSEKDPQFGGVGKYRKTPINTTLYFSSEEEMAALFSPHFAIEELKTVAVEGKRAPHLAVCVLMRPR